MLPVRQTVCRTSSADAGGPHLEMTATSSPTWMSAILFLPVVPYLWFHTRIVGICIECAVEWEEAGSSNGNQRKGKQLDRALPIPIKHYSPSTVIIDTVNNNDKVNIQHKKKLRK